MEVWKLVQFVNHSCLPNPLGCSTQIHGTYPDNLVVNNPFLKHAIVEYMETKRNSQYLPTFTIAKITIHEFMQVNIPFPWILWDWIMYLHSLKLTVLP